MIKFKYDYWQAAKDVMNYTFLGFLASLFLACVFIALAAWLFTALLVNAGPIFGIILACLVCIAIILVMTILRVKKKGKYYAEY